MLVTLALAPTVAWQPDPRIEGLTSSFEMLTDKHISELLPLQEDETLNGEWNARLGLQTMLRTEEFGNIVHQMYMLPWPLLPRDLLMQVCAAPTAQPRAIPPLLTPNRPSAPVRARHRPEAMGRHDQMPVGAACPPSQGSRGRPNGDRRLHLGDDGAAGRQDEDRTEAHGAKARLDRDAEVGH